MFEGQTSRLLASLPHEIRTETGLDCALLTAGDRTVLRRAAATPAAANNFRVALNRGGGAEAGESVFTVSPHTKPTDQECITNVFGARDKVNMKVPEQFLGAVQPTPGVDIGAARYVREHLMAKKERRGLDAGSPPPRLTPRRCPFRSSTLDTACSKRDKSRDLAGAHGSMLPDGSTGRCVTER